MTTPLDSQQPTPDIGRTRSVAVSEGLVAASMRPLEHAAEILDAESELSIVACDTHE